MHGPRQTQKRASALRIGLLLAIIAVYAAIAAMALNTRLQISHHTIRSPKVGQPLRVALLTDLHSCDYGPGQRGLVEALDSQKPDLILLGGDIFDDHIDDAKTIELLGALTGKVPLFYVTGNHEYWSRRVDGMLTTLRSFGVRVLAGEYATLSIRGQPLNIAGVDDPDVERYTTHPVPHHEQLQRAAQATGQGLFTILLSHRPELTATYQKYTFDLILAGHAHGGQWRLPPLIDGVFAPDQGFWPKFAGGRYTLSPATTMIVSRGLARESTRVPRVWNRPELVIVDIAPAP